MISEPKATFAYFDGDDVGASIELLMLQDDVIAAAEVSSRVSSAIKAISDYLESTLGGKVFFAAGDEVLVRLNTPPQVAEVESLRNQFHEITGLSISCGIASSAQEAAHQLRLAKLRGKNQTAGGQNGQ